MANGFENLAWSKQNWSLVFFLLFCLQSTQLPFISSFSYKWYNSCHTSHKISKTLIFNFLWWSSWWTTLHNLVLTSGQVQPNYKSSLSLSLLSTQNHLLFSINILTTRYRVYIKARSYPNNYNRLQIWFFVLNSFLLASTLSQLPQWSLQDRN